MVSEYDELFKIIVVGNQNCGKSALVQRYVHDNFKQYEVNVSPATDFYNKNIQLQGTKIQLQIWDCKPVSNSRISAPVSSKDQSHFSGAHGMMICLDLTDSEALSNLDKWIEWYQKYFAKGPIVMVGCKSDLTTKILHKKSDIDEFVNKYKLIYAQTSSKDDTGITEAFQAIPLKRLEEQKQTIVLSESLNKLKHIALQHFNAYLTSVSSSSSGFFSSYTQQSTTEYKLQEEYRLIYNLYFGENKDFSFTESDFISATQRIIERADAFHRSQNPFVSNVTSNPLSRALSDTLKDLAANSDTIKAKLSPHRNLDLLK